MENTLIDNLFIIPTAEELAAQGNNPPNPDPPTPDPDPKDPPTPDPQDPPTPDPTPTPDPSEVDDPDDSDDSDDAIDADFTPYYETLKEMGALVVPEDFEFDGTEASLVQALELSKVNTKAAAARELWENLPEDFQGVLEYALSGGQSINDYLNIYEDDVTKLDISSPENQRKILYKYFKASSGHPDERIYRMIDKYEEGGTLDVTAQEALEDLKEMQEQAKLDLQKQAQQARREAELRNQELVQGITESIGVITKDSTRKNKLKAFFFNQLDNQGRKTTEFDLVINSIRSNPAHLVQLADLLLDYSSDKGFNLDRFVKKGETRATKSLQKLLETTPNPQSKLKSALNSDPHEEKFDWGAFNKHF